MGVGLDSEATAICEAANAPDKLGWFTVSRLLQEKYKDIYEQFAIASRGGDELHRIVSEQATSYPYAFWCSGGDLNMLQSKIKVDFASFLGRNNPSEQNSDMNANIVGSVLKDIIGQMWQARRKSSKKNIWILQHQERRELMDEWASQIDHRDLADKLVKTHLLHYEANRRLLSYTDVADAQCLQNKQVVGLTTTACAARWEMLKRVDFRVVICEEAAEVMEAHTLCSLFPSIEHAIFIGDPLQLR